MDSESYSLRLVQTTKQEAIEPIFNEMDDSIYDPDDHSPRLNVRRKSLAEKLVTRPTREGSFRDFEVDICLYLDGDLCAFTCVCMSTEGKTKAKRSTCPARATHTFGYSNFFFNRKQG